jgi:hypothetical protein
MIDYERADPWHRHCLDGVVLLIHDHVGGEAAHVHDEFVDGRVPGDVVPLDTLQDGPIATPSLLPRE